MRKGPQPRAGLRPLSIFLGKFPRQSVPRRTISRIRARPRISGGCPADADTPAHTLSNREIPCARLQASLSIKGLFYGGAPANGRPLSIFLASPEQNPLHSESLTCISIQGFFAPLRCFPAKPAASRGVTREGLRGIFSGKASRAVLQSVPNPESLRPYSIFLGKSRYGSMHFTNVASHFRPYLRDSPTYLLMAKETAQ